MPPQQDNPENENLNFTPIVTAPAVTFGLLPTPVYPPFTQETNNLVGPEQPD